MRCVWIVACVLVASGCESTQCQAPTIQSGEPGVCHVPDIDAGVRVELAGSTAPEAGRVAWLGMPTRDTIEVGGAGQPGNGVQGGRYADGDSCADCGNSGGSGGAVATVAAGSTGGSAGVRSGGAGAGGQEAGKVAPVVIDPPKPSCGDGSVNGDETCDPSSKTPCQTASECTPHGCWSARFTGNADECSAKCELLQITDRQSGDGCCPANASAENDSDCPCGGDGDCGAGSYCSSGSCHSRACKDDNGCVTDRWCSSVGQCELRRAGLCTRDRQCPSGKSCKPMADSMFSECQ